MKCADAVLSHRGDCIVMQIAEGFSGRLAVEAVDRVRLSAIALRSSELPHL